MIKNRLPWVELAVRKVFEKLDVDCFENNAFSCCPEPNGIKNYNHYLYSLAASRNLALAERNNRNIITPCNGCFETLKSTLSEVSIDPDLKTRINNDLGEIGLNCDTKIEVFHILEFLSEKIGVSTIKDLVTYPLYGLKVAVHYGCHFLRPSNKIQTDNPLNPHVFDELVEALGAKSIAYEDKMLCCGGSFDRAGKKSLGIQMMKHKLERISAARADAIVVCCPQCFIQFDFLQRELKKIDYIFNIPVFYYPELMAIAFGINPEELGLKKHVTDALQVFQKVEKIKEANLEIQKNFDLDFLKECFKCSACNNDCPPARFSDFDPQGFVGRILDGDINGCLEDPDIWECLDCYLCYELCPSKVGLVDVFTKLRNLAAERGIVTPGFETEFKTFLKSGMVGKFSITQRKKLKLSLKSPEVDDIVSLMAKIMDTKKKEKNV